MKSTQMAIVPKKAFAFCRFTICILFWITAILLFFDLYIKSIINFYKF